MPYFESRHFGRIEYQDDTVFDFPAGLPGFEQETRFVPIEHPTSRPVVFLQSLGRSELCFITLPVLVVDPDYRLAVPPEDLESLHLDSGSQPAIGQDVLCLAILSVAENAPPTANLLAPLVVNLKNHRGVQAIQEESGYSHQTPLNLRE